MLLGGEASALSVARSLGRAGIDVIAVGDAAWAPVRHSRYCTRFVNLPTPDGTRDEWLEWLEQDAQRAALLPCMDEGVELIARNRARLEELGYHVYDMDDEIAMAMLDKQRTYELAREVGVPAPRTLPLANPADAAAVPAEIGFPCGIKPVYPNEWRRRFSVLDKLFVVSDLSELEHALELSRGLSMLATEIIPGGDDRLWAYYTYMEDGVPLFEFVRQKIRQHPPDFGIGSYAVSRWNDDVAAMGRRYFTGIGLRGLAYVEFKLDPRNGRLVLIEVNHRFGNLNELMQASGIDAALLVYNRVVGRPASVVHGFREGIRLLFAVQDARTFLIRRRQGELTLGRWLTSLLHRLRFPVLAADDPVPSLAAALQLAQRGLRRLHARGGRA